MPTKSKKHRKDATKHHLEVVDRHRFWRISIHFGQNENFRTVGLIDKSWSPVKVAAAFERLALRTRAIDPKAKGAPGAK